MMTLVTAVRWFLTGRGGPGPDRGRGWKVWDLDSELLYEPVVAALPHSELGVCEVGSGPAGLAEWTDRPILGIDPGSDARHGSLQQPPNLRRLRGAPFAALARRVHRGPFYRYLVVAELDAR